MIALSEAKAKVEYLLKQRWHVSESTRAIRALSHEYAMDEDIGAVAAAGHLSSAATHAGKNLPTIAGSVLDKPHENLHTFYTLAELDDFFENLSRAENVVAIARSLVVKKFHGAIKSAERWLADDDEYGNTVGNGILEFMLKEITDAGSSPEAQYAALVDAQMDEARLIAASLPTDFPTLQAVLCERMEAAATGRQKHLKGAITQQAIDNWAQCAGIDTALQEVSKQCAIACIAIQRATDAAAAQAAFDAGVKAIEAVTAVHTPVWEIDGTGYEANPASPVAISKGSVNVTAKHPDGQMIDGDVVVAFVSTKPIRVLRGGLGTLTPVSADGGVVAIKDPKPGETVTVTATARSLCGPSSVEVALTPPETLP